MIEQSIISAIDELQTKYICALQSKDMNEWLACFDSTASYICIARENVDQNLPLAIMMDDCYERLLDRVNYVTQVWSGTYEDYTARHFVQRLKCDGANGVFSALSNFMVTYVSASGASEVLVSGYYQDEIVCENGAAKFRSKQAVLDTVVMPRYLVYPV